MTLITGSSISNTYDHIIIGGGSAGCLIAARLTEDSACRVLMIEAGTSDIDRPSMIAPGAWPQNLGSDVDWQYRTVPQSNVAGRVFDWNRGKVLGGSSAINAMVWAWGHRNDFDSWADEGNVGWDFESLRPIFLGLETDAQTSRNNPRGTDGPMQLGSIAGTVPFTEAFLESCRKAGHPVLDDVNGPVTDGVGAMDLNIKNGQRFSVAQAFLLPALSRQNLTVLANTLVESLIFDGSRCVGVRCRVNGGHREFHSNHDVVLSTGTIGSPQILLRSGIGNAEDLRRLGIEVVVDLPGVGENLHDHCLVSAFAAETVENVTNTGRFGLHIYMRSGAALSQPNLEIVLSAWPTGLPNVPMGKGFALVAGLLQPKSRGKISLGAAIDAPLLIDPNYLSDAADLEALCVAVESCTELGLSADLSPWRAHAGAVRVPPSGKAELQEFVKANMGTYWHPVGTCAMGVGNRSVVDSSLRVYGISNLRIADSSVIPRITTGNTLAPTLVIAELAARKISAGVRA